MYEHAGLAWVGLFVVGAIFLFVYGLALNLAPVEFGRVVGLYIATLFLVWQVGSFLAFLSLPSLPILVGGSLIVAGGLIVTYWNSGASAKVLPLRAHVHSQRSKPSGLRLNFLLSCTVDS